MDNHTISNRILNLYAEAANILNINYKIVDPARLLSFFKNDKHWAIAYAIVPLNNAVAAYLASSKHLSLNILSNQGIPVPKQIATLKSYL